MKIHIFTIPRLVPKFKGFKMVDQGNLCILVKPIQCMAECNFHSVIGSTADLSHTYKTTPFIPCSANCIRFLVKGPLLEFVFFKYELLSHTLFRICLSSEFCSKRIYVLGFGWVNFIFFSVICFFVCLFLIFFCFWDVFFCV